MATDNAASWPGVCLYQCGIYLPWANICRGVAALQPARFALGLSGSDDSRPVFFLAQYALNCSDREHWEVLRESRHDGKPERCHSGASSGYPPGLGGPHVLHGGRDLRVGFQSLADAAQFNEAQCGHRGFTDANMMSTKASIGRGLLSRL
jgi:hypothetical protein